MLNFEGSLAEECYYIRNVTRPTAQSTDESGMEYSLAAEPCSGEIPYMTISELVFLENIGMTTTYKYLLIDLHFQLNADSWHITLGRRR
jgi:hypothetical protein